MKQMPIILALGAFIIGVLICILILIPSPKKKTDIHTSSIAVNLTQ
jgi:hypothetical protein